MNKEKRIEEEEINKRIVLLFLEKIEILTAEERKEILTTIQLLNHPMLIAK